jgi:hypothetical protein
VSTDSQAIIDYTVAHWRVVDDGLEWQPCGPECTHEPQKKVTARLTAAAVYSDDIDWMAG